MKPFDIPLFEITIRSDARREYGKDYLVIIWNTDIGGKEQICRKAYGAEFVKLEEFLDMTFKAIKNDLLRELGGELCLS